MEPLLSYGSVGRLLDVSDDTVRRLVKRGLLAPPDHYDGIGVRFRQSDVLLYLAKARQPRNRGSRTPQGDANAAPPGET